MAIAINLRLNDGDKERLEEIARQAGALGAGGYAVGQPSISTLLRMIAASELGLVGGPVYDQTRSLADHQGVRVADVVDAALAAYLAGYPGRASMAKAVGAKGE